MNNKHRKKICVAKTELHKLKSNNCAYGIQVDTKDTVLYICYLQIIMMMVTIMISLKISQQTNIILVFKMSENQCITCFSKKEIINPDHKPILAEFSF